eukprot:6359605-Amphidinium_carterae.1
MLVRALADSGLQSIDTISELGKMGKMVRHDPTHLRGLNALVATLVKPSVHRKAQGLVYSQDSRCA